MKLRINLWSITWRYLIVFFIIFAIAFSTSFNLFFTVNENRQIIGAEFGTPQIIFVVVFAGLFIGTYLAAIFGFYYIVEDKFFVVKRLGKEQAYDYVNIEFIDIETSKKKNQVIFYTKKAKVRYLLGDKDGVLLETLIKKCPNIMTVSEFRARHPEERY